MSLFQVQLAGCSATIRKGETLVLDDTPPAEQDAYWVIQHLNCPLVSHEEHLLAEIKRQAKESNVHILLIQLTDDWACDTLIKVSE